MYIGGVGTWREVGGGGGGGVGGGAKSIIILCPLTAADQRFSSIM